MAKKRKPINGQSLLLRSKILKAKAKYEGKRRRETPSGVFVHTDSWLGRHPLRDQIITCLIDDAPLIGLVRAIQEQGHDRDFEPRSFTRCLHNYRHRIREQILQREKQDQRWDDAQAEAI